MKRLVWLIVAALVGLGVYDIVRTVRQSYTTGFSRPYFHPVGMLMSAGFDTLRLSGRGVRIGVLDAGFGDFRENRWTRGLDVGAWKDFTGGDDAAFFDDEVDHGTMVCANVGGFSGDTLRGLAYGATYFLAKTDRADVEPRCEEQQMIRGIEWLLSHEVDIITSSLAYTEFDDFKGYTPSMLDGRTSVLSHYLDSLLTARPDLVFVQSAGNEGDKEWKYISFPGDVRDVITVGSCDAEGQKRYRSSGVGFPGAEYLKPDFVTSASPIGTSFSTPIVTGLCACVLEYRPMCRDSLLRVLRASATRASDPDLMIGYGVPQTGRILELLHR